MPVLLLHGSEDPFVPYRRSLQAAVDMPARSLRVHIYEGGRHEILNETNRDQVVGHLIEWLEQIPV
jgi:alpha-beta hydrolase superfamily lysophospholipase